MTVEQTTQLIQLILNSVLLTMACALMYNRVATLHSAIGDRLQVGSQHYTELAESQVEPRSERLLSFKKQLRYLQQRHTVTHYSLLAVNYALFFAVISTFTLALRSLFNLEILIPLALALFVVGIVGLLMGVGLTLVDLHSADRALWLEVSGFLSGYREERRLAKVRPMPTTPRQRASRTQPVSRARVS